MDEAKKKSSEEMIYEQRSGFFFALVNELGNVDGKMDGYYITFIWKRISAWNLLR